MSASRAARLLRQAGLYACLVAALCGVDFRAQAQVLAEPPLLLPAAIAYDSAGDLFFADARRHQVFELTVAGTWSVIAGTGEQGFAGDGGPATTAILNGPRGLTVAPDGTLYIADTGNQRIRSISKGVINTIAGTGARGYSGDGAAATAALHDPTALAMDASGNLLLCDTGNQRVRRIAGGNIVTIAGTGVQGYSGDAGAAVSAQLDTPQGLAVMPDGTVLIADTHNQRVRALHTDGTLGTFAGTGARGFGGDGGQAASALLDLPFSVAVGSNGTVLIADAGNQRVRAVSSAGVITTLAGSGVQGTAPDATGGAAAALNNPRSVGVQLQGLPVLADSGNGLLRELAGDNALYTLALLTAPRASSVTIGPGSSLVYGQTSATVRVSGSAAPPQGTVMLSDNGSFVSAAQLLAGASAFSLAQLGVGSHTLTAAYAGDGLHGSAASPPVPLTVAAAPVIATANPAMAVYGAALPALTGTVSGVLPQDSAAVHAVFSAAAAGLAAVGTYPITAALSGAGSGNYVVSQGQGSGSLVISQAASATKLQATAATYAGLPILLSAQVVSTTSGSPSGSVDFLDGANVIGSAALVNGAAGTSVLAPAQGTHTYAARYRGDTNFLPSTSAMANAVVSALPDFGLNLASASQSVQGGSAALFTVQVTPVNGAFTGAVSFSVSGLPQGAVATFSPALVVPGAAETGITLSVQTPAKTGSLRRRSRSETTLAALWIGLLCGGIYRSRRRRQKLFAFALICCLSLTLGCGTRTVGSPASQGQTSTLSVTGTGTNLAGVAVAHSVSATLIVF